MPDFKITAKYTDGNGEKKKITTFSSRAVDQNGAVVLLHKREGIPGNTIDRESITITRQQKKK